jgi:hypothetical protein
MKRQAKSFMEEGGSTYYRTVFRKQVEAMEQAVLNKKPYHSFLVR